MDKFQRSTRPSEAISEVDVGERRVEDEGGWGDRDLVAGVDSLVLVVVVVDVLSVGFPLLLVILVLVVLVLLVLVLVLVEGFLAL